MIFPEDYKLVGVKDCDRPGDPIYFSTRYLISLEGPRLYEVESQGEGFLREVVSLALISSGDEIAFWPDIVDTRNRSGLVEMAASLCRGPVRTVVFKGPDEHMTFVHEPDTSGILTIEIFDATPPDPPWLVHVIRSLEGTGILGDLMVRFAPKVIDLRDVGDEDVYYPCRASGLSPSLDHDPVEGDLPVIVGCEISREVFKSRYPGRDHEFFNTCPLHSLDPRGPFITRCCRSERRGPTEKNGFKGTVVHWGDGPKEIYEALRSLVEGLRRQV